MRWIEPLTCALIAPTIQFVEFGDLFDLGTLAYGETMLSLHPVVYGVVVVAVLLGWGLVALAVRFILPRLKSADTARLLRMLGLFVLWSAVMIVPLYDSPDYSGNWERVAMLWTVFKIGLGVMLAFVVVLITERLRARAGNP